MTVVLALMKAALVTRYWVIFTHIAQYGSLIAYVLFLWLYTGTNFAPTVSGILSEVLLQPCTLLGMLVLAIGIMGIDYAITTYTRWWRARPWEILRERDVVATAQYAVQTVKVAAPAIKQQLDGIGGSSNTDMALEVKPTN